MNISIFVRAIELHSEVIDTTDVIISNIHDQTGCGALFQCHNA